MIKTILIISLILTTVAVNAQIKYPELSSKGIIVQNIGFASVKIDYERPSARGRTIFGELVPYGKLWRTGAGTCTKINFKEPVLLNNLRVSAGTYSLFSIPNLNEWTIIINSDTSLIGADKYEQKKDIIRFNVKSSISDRFHESLTFDIDVVSNNAEIYISWEKTQIHFSLGTFTDEKVITYIRQNLLTGKSKDWNDYASGAEYYWYNNIDLNEALILANLSIENNGESFSYFMKMQILEKQKRYTEAIEVAKRGLEYVQKNGSRLGYNNDESKSWESKITLLKEKSKGK